MCSGPPPPPCSNNPLVINMFDSWGDGWNGASYTIINDATGATVGTGTLSNGSSGTSSIYCILDGCYTVVVTDGTYPTEVSWTATINGVVYASGGAGSSTQLPINSFCTPPTPEMKIPSTGNNTYSVCEGVLYDNGGSTGNYSVNANGYTTLYPESAGAQLSITFTTFNLETNWDYVYVYDGNSTAAPLLGTFTGTASPGNFISTASDGSLTIRLTSDGSIQYGGFSAEISCLIALPIEMLWFDGLSTEQGNVVSWETSFESNSSHFTIERSTTKEFNENSVIGYKPAAGNSTENIGYAFIDRHFESQINYYQITQVDNDGNYKTYGPIVIDNTKTSKTIIKYLNLLGQEIDPQNTIGLVIEVYSDGSSRRVLR